MEEEKCSTCRDLEKLSNLAICETSLRRENSTNKAFYTKNQISKATFCENCLKDHPWNCTHTKALKFKHTNTKSRIETVKMLPKNLTDLMAKAEKGIQRFAQILEMEIQSAEQVTDPIELNQKCNNLETHIEKFTKRFEEFEQFPEFVEDLLLLMTQNDEMRKMIEEVALSGLKENSSHEKDRDSNWDLEIEKTHSRKYSSRHSQNNPLEYLGASFLSPDDDQSGYSGVTGSDFSNFRDNRWSRMSSNREKLSSPHTTGSETPTSQTQPPSSLDDEIQYTAAPPINYDYSSAAYQVENAIRKRWHIKIWGLSANRDEITFRIENKSETPMLIKFEQWTPGMNIRFKGSNDYQEKKEHRRAFELPAHKSEVVKIIITDRVRKSLDENNKAPFVRFHGIGQLMGTKYNFVVRTINCNLEKDQWKPVEI